MDVDLHGPIMDFRQLLNDAGLYYAPETSPVSLFHYLGVESDEVDQWATIEGYKQMMSHRDESNMEVILDDLNKLSAHNDFTRLDNGEYAIRVFDPDGEMTETGARLEQWAGSLMDYPILDDEDVSQREYDETLDNIRAEAPSVSEDAPDDWEKQVFGWLWDNNQDALEHRTENGGSWVSEEDIEAALSALGWLEEDDDLEFDVQARYKKGLGSSQVERIATRLKS